jgi:uncharacterized membrane protein
MNKARIEAFSDGVIAIIITIMVLEFKVPHGEHLADLVPLWPVFLSYVLSFANVGIYWANHHHLFHATKHVNGSILLGNLNLLFWMSLIPFTTAWVGENHFAAMPMAVYAFDLSMCAVAYTILLFQIIQAHGKDSLIAQAIGNDAKGKISLAAYVFAIPLALFGLPIVSGLLILAVACMWMIPDRRIERKLNSQ